MSWDAWLTDDRGHSDGDWDYTHNCNGMANAVLDDLLPEEHRDESWWRHLHGMDGPAGAAFLDQIIRGLEADPDRFRAMNPTNGWGDYDSFVKRLTEMRDAVPEWPTTWSVHG